MMSSRSETRERKSRKEVLEDHIKSVALHACGTMDQPNDATKGLLSENSNEEVRLRTLTKSRLQRMGTLYSGKENLSSPIQRTEEKFCIEEETIARPSAKSEARSARLARLANFINEWEDDLSHPVINKEPPVRYDKFGNVLKGSPPKKVYGKPLELELQKKAQKSHKEISGKKTQKPLKEITEKLIQEKPSSALKKSDEKPVIVKESLKRDVGINKDNFNEPIQPKRVMWDSTMIASLESKGFERCESKQHLVYDYKEQSVPAKCLSPSRKTNESAPPKSIANPPVAFSPPSSPLKSSPKKSRAVYEEVPENQRKSVFSAAIVRELSPTKVVHPAQVLSSPGKRYGSPLKEKESQTRSPSPRKNTQVLEMAAQYEEVSSSPTKRLKETDPSELPLSQRMALFEKNKGQAILPKAPFSQSVPQKVLSGNAPAEVYLTPVTKKPPQLDAPSSEKLKQIRQEREKEMDALRSRWDNAKARVSPTRSPPPPIPKGQPLAVPLKKAPSPPPMPEYESDSEDQPSSSSDLSADSEITQCPNTGDYVAPKSPPRLNTSYPSMKKIKVSPPKPGRLYPSISDIETETESEFNDNNNFHSSINDDSLESSEVSTVESLGQRIIDVAKKSTSNLKRFNSTSEEEVRVLGEMDDFLDEALGEPSPPKKSRDSSFDSYMDEGLRRCDSGSVGSDSFEFGQNSGTGSTDQFSSSSASGQTQLVHTISLYRKQKKMTIKSTTTVTREKVTKFNQPIIEESQDETSDNESVTSEKSEGQLVADKIHDLSLEVSRQQTVIFQASQALNLCSSTIEFSGSTEQIEAEKLLLIASQRRLALTHEIDRLRVEKTLRTGGGKSTEKGNLTIERITLPLKMDVIRSSAREEKCWYTLVLARCGPTVVASDMLAALPKNLKQSEPYNINFTSPLVLQELYSDFAVTLEIYALEARSKELLPHDVKYHITPSAKKEKLRMTPKKGSKNAGSLVIGPMESPAGPLAVRSSSFKLNGFAVFSLRDIGKTCFSLNKVQYGSVVEGNVQVKMSCEMTLAGLEYRGFLTMFQDVSGFGAWHRRWCYLKDNTISYWLYPEHETTKIPIDTIDLSEVVSDGEVGLVSRDICARPNTFLLEVIRPRLPTDQDSLVMKTNKNTTLIKHLLSADTKEDRFEWCTRINKYLSLLKVWGKRPVVQHTSV